MQESKKPTTHSLQKSCVQNSHPLQTQDNPSIIQLFNIDLHHQIINRKIQPSQPDPFPISKDTLFT